MAFGRGVGGGGTYRDNRFTAQTMHSDQSNKAYRRNGSNIICEQLTYIKLIHWESYARRIVRPRKSNRISIILFCGVRLNFHFYLMYVYIYIMYKYINDVR